MLPFQRQLFRSWEFQASKIDYISLHPCHDGTRSRRQVLPFFWLNGKLGSLSL